MLSIRVCGIGLTSMLFFSACSNGTVSPVSQDASVGLDAGRLDAAAEQQADAAVLDPCGGAPFCELFDDYEETTLVNDQRFGLWRAKVGAAGGGMDLSSTRSFSGERALHVHIDKDAKHGGRLFTDGDVPFLQGRPDHIYGRMMMYIEPNGRSTHWTFFGAQGDVEPSSPEVGRRATYLMSSLPRNEMNTYSFVYGLSPRAPEPYQDCWSQGNTPMPSGQWTCVQFELDSVTRKLRMFIDGESEPIVSVDNRGTGCVGDVVPNDSPWYGPVIDSLYVGAWSFHSMVDELDLWIDDLIIDTQPVACPGL